MVHAAGPELLTHFVSGGQSKIGDSKSHAPVEAKNVLRLEVTMIDTHRMTILDRIEELKEYVLDQVILAKITSLV